MTLFSWSFPFDACPYCAPCGGPVREFHAIRGAGRGFFAEPRTAERVFSRIVVNECEARRVSLCVFVLFRRCFCQAYHVSQMACRAIGPCADGAARRLGCPLPVFACLIFARPQLIGRNTPHGRFSGRACTVCGRQGARGIIPSWTYVFARKREHSR